MRAKLIFGAELFGFFAVYLCYGFTRLRLGVDLTDEGAYLAWPLRGHFGEAPFSSELLTLIRPVEVYLSFVFRLNPGLTLYEFRMLGWLVHLAAFAVLALVVFLLSNAPLRSVLIASVPLFICEPFGLASPSYNTLSSDFLVMALSLRAIAALTPRHRMLLGFASGGAFFIATFAHPGLGLLAAAMLAYEIWPGGLVTNYRQGRLTATNLGAMVFVALWAAFLIYASASGAVGEWRHRIAFSRAPATYSGSWVRLLATLCAYPFAYSRLALALTLVIVLAGCVVARWSRSARADIAAIGPAALGFALVATLSLTFSFENSYFPLAFVMVALLATTVHFTPAAALVPAPPGVRVVMLGSCGAALIYAALTYFFTPYRSWISGMQGLPFAFAAALALLSRVKSGRCVVVDAMFTAALGLVVVCAARDHYRNIYRDDSPPALQARFNLPKLRSIQSTPERVDALEGLYRYLHDKIPYGGPLLAFDDCPLLYYLFDARPAYGMAWAVRYGQSPAVLARLNDELKARPLPTYAIRTLVDPSHVIWRSAPRTNYANYPLNETLLANYVLERTIFPFEIWRVKSAP